MGLPRYLPKGILGSLGVAVIIIFIGLGGGFFGAGWVPSVAAVRRVGAKREAVLGYVAQDVRIALGLATACEDVPSRHDPRRKLHTLVCPSYGAARAVEFAEDHGGTVHLGIPIVRIGKMMTSRQRVLYAFAHQEPDQVAAAWRAGACSCRVVASQA